MPIVLVIEDSDNVAALEIALASLVGLETVTLRNGREALKILNSSALDIAAVITDIHLPFVDGFELISAIRDHPRYARIPILAVSGDTQDNISTQVSKLGADAFFTKPFSPLEVCRTLKKLLYAP